MSAPQDHAAGQSSSSASTGNTPAPSTAATSASHSGSEDGLVCKWNQCNERFNAAESLYVSCLLVSLAEGAQCV